MSNTFSSKDRLLTSADFKYVFDNPLRSSDSAYTILARQNKLGDSRLGVIVSKKNVPKATARNHQKRIVRESFRLHKDIINKFDVVVICKKNCARMVNKKLFERLQKHWMFLHDCAE